MGLAEAPHRPRCRHCGYARFGLGRSGEALASDNTAVVQRWIDEQAIAKPTQAELADWDRSGNARFQAMIVAPFVLVKLITD